jgi:membrane protein
MPGTTEPPGRIRRTARRLRTSARPTWERLQERDLMLLAAALTFYAAIAVIPLLLIAVHLVGLVLGHDEVQRLAGDLAETAPEGLGFAARLVDLAEAGAALSPLAVAAALVPATTFGEGLLRGFDRLAGVRTRGKGLRGRLRAIALLAVLPLLVLGGLTAVAVLPGVLGPGAGGTLLGAYLTFWVAWIGATALLEVTYRAFSPVRLGGFALRWSAVGTGSFLAGMSLGWVLVLEIGVEVGQAYGGSEVLGAAVLFAVYLYLVQLTCLVGYAWALTLQDQPAP